MPKAARKISATGMYHIIIRGINRQTIFVDDEDNEKFIEKEVNSRKILIVAALTILILLSCLACNKKELILKHICTKYMGKIEYA
jgi:hypothetical protein